MEEFHGTSMAQLGEAAPDRRPRLDLDPDVFVRSYGRAAAAAPGVRNSLLSKLDPLRLNWLRPHMTRVRLKRGKVLFESSASITHVFFPEDCAIAVVVPMQSGACPQACLIGRDGMTDCMTAFGDATALAHNLVLVGGDAIRLPVWLLREGVENHSDVRAVVQSYCGQLLAQSVQSAGCHALHPAQARLARLLLALQAKLPLNSILPLTQETIAGMLGVQRTTVTAAADSLQRSGAILVRRGMVIIQNADKLAEAACECHATVSLMQREPLRRQGAPH